LVVPEIDTSLTEEHKTDDNQLNSVYAREYDTELTSSLDGNSDINDFDVKKRNVKNGNTESGMIENENNEFRQIMTADVCTLHEVIIKLVLFFLYLWFNLIYIYLFF
jgi:hypothetical protein